MLENSFIKEHSRKSQINVRDFYFSKLSVAFFIIFILFCFQIPPAFAQNKIVFTDSEVASSHGNPAESMLGKIDRSKTTAVEKINEYGLNSIFNELGPLVEPGGDRLFFSRSNHPGNTGGVKDDEDIWVATWDKSLHSWTKVERLGEPLNTMGPNFITSISVEDGIITLILGNTYKDGEISGEGLSYSEFINNKWTNPTNFTIKGFVNKSEYTDFFVSEDGQYLLISAEMDDSKGGRDIYLSHRIDKTSWDKPMNLAILNTPKDETAPSFSPDERFLFYSSEGLEGYGGLDIFYSRREDEGWHNWSKPTNLGPQFNDAFDNNHFSLPPAGEKIFFVTENEQGNTDINSFVTTSEELYSELTGEPICLAEKVFTSENSFSHKLPVNLCVDLEYLPDSPRSNVKYKWTYGDTFFGEGQKVSHCYDVHGNYDIKLSILDATTNQEISAIDHVYELNEFLELKVEGPNAGIINKEMKFSSHLAGAYPANAEYYWDFGDGYFSCGNETSHTFILPKDYELRALVTFQWQGRLRQLMTATTVSIKK